MGKSSHITKRLQCDFYFAHPDHSCVRGPNENTNGLLRQYFPKCTDFKMVRGKAVKQSVDQLNNRPRKALTLKIPAALKRAEMTLLAT